jgi:hypothetical protein
MLTDCEKQIGYVIFDSVCLMLGAAELRAGVTAEAAEEMAEACKPIINKFDSYILTMSSKESSVTEVAGAVFMELLHSEHLPLLSLLMVLLKSASLR